MRTWQPLVTAPKDGTRILLCFPELERPVQIGFWLDVEERRYGQVERVRREWALDSAPFWPLRPNTESEKAAPVAWMPLPESLKGGDHA